MKKTVALILAIMFLASSVPGVALATTATQSTADLIAQLTAQIEVLKAKLVELKAAQSAVQTSSVEIGQTLKLLNDLKFGMSNEEVKLLQALLASDSDVYPEKIITGYYGHLTIKAIKRFQHKHGISETGYTGPLTRAQLNKLLASAPVSMEDSDDGDSENDGDDNKKDEKGDNKKGVRFCLTVPPGHLVAPGWKKHHGNDEETTLPVCSKIPGGIAKKLGDATTTPPDTADTIAPTVSLIAVASISHSGATVTWTTSELSLSKIYVGTSASVATVTPVWTDANLALTHSASLTGLLASTTYHFVVSAKDASGNESFSGVETFTTALAPVVDITAPIVSGIGVTGVTDSGVTIAWVTDESARSDVYVSETSPVSTSTPAWTDANFALTHSTSLTGLSASTTYYMVIAATDADENMFYSSTESFVTTL